MKRVLLGESHGFRHNKEVIFGKRRKQGLRRQDSKARVRAWRNALVGLNIFILLAASAYVLLKRSGLIDSWLVQAKELPQTGSAAPESRLVVQTQVKASATAEAMLESSAKEPRPSTADLLQTAQEAYNTQSFESTVRQAKKALEVATLDLEKAQALNLMGKVQTKKGAPEAAVADHLAAIKAWPTLDTSYLLLADNLRRLGHAAAAITFLEEAAMTCGDNPYFDLKKMLAKIELGDLKTVEQEIQSKIVGSQLPAQLAFVQAVILHRSGKRNEAQRLAEAIHKQVSEQEWANFLEDPATPSIWSEIISR